MFSKIKYSFFCAFVVFVFANFSDSQIIERAYHAQADSNQLFVPDDLEATLWAESPLFYNPTNIDIDSRGRVWVTEAVNYRNFNNKPDKKLSFEGGDRVVIIEDTDQDGKADKSTVFVQDKDLVSPLGIAVIGNKVIVSCAPNLIVYTDIDGDDVPDKKEILLKGFGGLDHDHSLHSLTAGPDGNWHFNTGNAGPHHVTDKNGWQLRSGSIYTGGTPYGLQNQGLQKSDDGRVWVGGLALRMTPEGKLLKVMAHNFRNSYEVAIDSYGNYWQNDNDDQVVACRTSWVMEGSNAGYFSSDGTRYWQADRRPDQDMFAAHWHQEDPGVLPVGDNTGAGSPTGMLVYEGDALGSKYRGMVLSCEAGRNVVFAYWPQPKGAGFEMGKRFDLISSFPKVDEHYIWHETDQDKRKWFRPSDIATGTDGALYVADWYDPVVGGHKMDDKIGYGRIFRITPKSKKLSNPKIDLNTTIGQIEALKNPAINVRNLGFEALKKQGEAVVPEVKELLKNTNPYIQSRAIWLLNELGNSGKKTMLKTFEETDNTLLKNTIFKSLRKGFDELAITNKKLADESYVSLCKTILDKDAQPQLLREIAISMRDVDYNSCKTIFLKLYQNFDGQDRYFLEALGIGLEGKEEMFYKDIRPTWPQNPEDWTAQQSWLTWRIHPVLAVNDLKTRAVSNKVSAEERKRAITGLAFIKDKSAVLAMLDLTKNKLKDVSEQALYWVNFRKTNDWANLLNWQTAEATKLSPKQLKMLDYQALMLNTKSAEKNKTKAAEVLALDPFGAKLLINLANNGKIPKDIKATIAQYIFNNPDKSIRMLAGEYFGRSGGKSLSQSLTASMPADIEKGEIIFTKNCATCHRINNDGAEIGPDLSLIGKKFDKNGLLDAILNPSASMAFGYEPWIIATKDKNTYYGFLIADAETVVLKDVAGQKIILKKSNIISRKQLTTSLMPDPTTMQLKEKDMADLVGFLLK